MDNHDLGRFALSTIGVLILLAAFLWWFQQRKGQPFGKLLERKIKVLEVYPLGLKHKMMLLHVDDQRILVAVNPQEIRTLHTWTSTINVDLQADKMELTNISSP
jgi:flagellar biogenesis protein FliO